MQRFLVRAVILIAVFGTFTVIVRTAFENAPDPDAGLAVVKAPDEPMKEKLSPPPVPDSESTVLDLIGDGETAPPPDAEERLSRALEEDALEEAAIAATEERLEEGVVDPPRGADESAAESAGDQPDGNEAPTAPPAAVAALSPAAADGAFRIQLAAVKPGVERAAWSDLQRKLGRLVADLDVHFQLISTDNGVLVRVQGVGFADEAAAKARCDTIRESGTGCFVVAASG